MTRAQAFADQEPKQDQSPGPEIILVHPQIGENIGTTARAMLNCGLLNLRLVKPREAWPNQKAIAAAAGAEAVLDRTRLFATTGEAVADLNRLRRFGARSPASRRTSSARCWRCWG